MTDLIDALPLVSRDTGAHFLGFIPNEDIVQVYLAADVLCMPGRAEPPSLATLEVLSCGLPVVAANATALPHLVTDNVKGFLYAPGDLALLSGSLSRILASPEARAAMGRASREIALAHDADLTIVRYWATLFGRRYVDMFGRERLRTAPAAKIELSADGYALLQASPRSGDVVASAGPFGAARERIIEHLGSDAFYDPQRPDARVATPVFDDRIS